MCKMWSMPLTTKWQGHHVAPPHFTDKSLFHTVLQWMVDCKQSLRAAPAPFVCAPLPARQYNNKKPRKKISKCLYKHKNTTHKWHIRFGDWKVITALHCSEETLFAVKLINICDKFSTNPEPPVSQAQVLTRHLQPLWPCCGSSFHHFHSPSPCVIAQVWVTASKQLH